MPVLYLPAAAASSGLLRPGGQRARFFAITLALLLVMTGATGCGRAQSSAAAEDGEFRITLVSQPNPPVVGQGILVVTLLDRTGAPAPGARIRIEGNMNHAGMTPVFSEAAGGENGRYEAPMNWTMGGDWTVDVKATLADGRTATRQFALTVNGGH